MHFRSHHSAGDFSTLSLFSPAISPDELQPLPPPLPLPELPHKGKYHVEDEAWNNDNPTEKELCRGHSFQIEESLVPLKYKKRAIKKRGKKRKIVPIKGIENGSNHCFKIAAMQLMFSMTAFLTSLHDRHSHHEPNDASSKLVTMHVIDIARSVGCFGKSQGNKHQRLESLLKMFEEIITLNVGFNDYAPNTDGEFAQEDINVLLQRLFCLLDEEEHDLCDKFLGMKLLDMRFCQSPDCGQKNQKTSKEVGIPLKLDEKMQESEVPLSIYCLLDHHFLGEKSIDSRCEKSCCGKEYDVKGVKLIPKNARFAQYTRVIHFPRYLILYIQRQASVEAKIHTPVLLPENLQMERYCLPGISAPAYTLCSVAYHQGEQIEEGHYMACVRVKNGANGDVKWYNFDDDRVDAITLDDVLHDPQKQKEYVACVYEIGTLPTAVETLTDQANVCPTESSVATEVEVVESSIKNVLRASSKERAGDVEHVHDPINFFNETGALPTVVETLTDQANVCPTESSVATKVETVDASIKKVPRAPSKERAGYVEHVHLRINVAMCHYRNHLSYKPIIEERFLQWISMNAKNLPKIHVTRFGENLICYPYVLGLCNNTLCHNLDGHVPKDKVTDDFAEKIKELLKEVWKLSVSVSSDCDMQDFIQVLNHLTKRNLKEIQRKEQK